MRKRESFYVEYNLQTFRILPARFIIVSILSSLVTTLIHGLQKLQKDWVWLRKTVPESNTINADITFMISNTWAFAAIFILF